jgi:hypothetical protein
MAFWPAIRRFSPLHTFGCQANPVPDAGPATAAVAHPASVAPAATAVGLATAVVVPASVSAGMPPSDQGLTRVCR